MRLRRGVERRSVTARTLVLATTLALVAAVGFAVGGAGAAQQSVRPAKGLGAKGHDGIVDVSRYLGRNSRVPVQVSPNKVVPLKRLVRQAKQLRAKQARIQKRQRSLRKARAFHAASPAVGTTRTWLALDDSAGFYRKQYTLRGVGSHSEVWVVTPVSRPFNGFDSIGTDFQAGDCRNGARTTVTDTQVNYLIGQFDNNILPKESAEFSVAPDRDGTNQTVLPPLNGVPSDSSGAGEKTVVLVDNVRDSNFRDLNNTQGDSYIAGFFSSGLNELFDRNVMTIDAFDWLHRTGANPPHEPVPGNNCTSAPSRPFLYEGVFAHEYQHLLEYYQDPEEVNWVNEGLSDFAIDVTGYDFATRPVSQIGFDSHLQCFMGNLVFQTDANPNPRGGGPENSLTLWGDQGDGEILCDYGAAFSMMEYLASQYGRGFMSALHRNPAEGFAGLQSVLGSRSIASVALHRWAAAMALDGVLDRGAKMPLVFVPKSRFQIAALDAGINWDNPDAYSSPGAPPNGSDYVRLRDGQDHYLKADDINSISFQGVKTLEPQPVEWTVTTAAPDHGTDAALAAPDADNKDAAIVRSVAVPAGSPTLTFDTKYDTEPGFDSFFVQVSTDGGKTYHSLANADTTCDLDPGADKTLKDNCPGLNGDSGGWKSETFDLSPYAGQTVLLAFRYITDANTRGSGVWVDNVLVGGNLVSDGSSLAGWQTFTQIKPVSVKGYTVQLVAYETTGNKPDAFVTSIPLTRNFLGTLDRNQVKRLIGKKADVVAALVMYDEPTESIGQYARYTLKVNNVVQPGG
ncbi:MAG: immune inhibitor A [Actinomycetota bacterium]|nr:immune inhibitor A [Actinomycetota bacterium]MDQ2981031.1 immune inhibitor A [Actinomycetota bacterium]